MRLDVKLEGAFYPVALVQGGRTRLRVGDRDLDSALEPKGGGRFCLTVDGQRHAVWVAVRGETVHVHAFGRQWELELLDPVDRAAGQGQQGENVVRAPMPGVVIEVLVAAGERVRKGQPLITIESMKLETVISAMSDGEVERVHLEAGSVFDRGVELVTLAREA